MVDGGQHLHLGGGEWYLATPPSAVPVPASSMVGDLAELPAMLVRAGVGVLTDLRVFGEASWSDGSLRVDLVSELDFWRSRLHPGEPVRALRMPIEQVWVEHRLDRSTSATWSGTEPDRYEVWRRLAPGPDTPGARLPSPARDVRQLHGRRLIQVTPHGWAYNLRAVSEPYDLDGEITVNVTAAEDYYRWLLSGTEPEITPLPLYVLWCE